MMKAFKKRDIVQFDTIICSIKKIEHGIATLSINVEVGVDKLSPVVIRGGRDSNIQCGCSNLRWPVNGVQKEYTGIFDHPYLEYRFDNKTIKSIIMENGLKYVHQLQNWLQENEPEIFLYL